MQKKNEEVNQERLIKLEEKKKENKPPIIDDLDPKSLLLLEHQAKQKFIMRLISLFMLFFGVIGFIIWFFLIR